MKQNSNVQPDSLNDNLRDYILVLTSTGEVETLRVRDIEKVISGPSSETSHVYVRRENSRVLRMVVIAEAARGFQKRCENLLAALQAHNWDLINKFFAPPRVG